MNKIDYLNRFHANLTNEISYNSLKELQFLHMQHVPFENLDVIRRTPIYLNLERIYEKVVTRKRGGYCYELNGLFHWLLKELGYQANLVAATVQKPDGSWAKADTHAAIVVELDQAYLMDVGFGDSTLSPIPLDGTAHTDHSGTYWVTHNSDNFYELNRQTGEHNRVLYKFSRVYKQLLDFHEGCVYNQVSKKSTFTHDDLITRATTNGRITLSGMQLSRTVNGKKDKTELTEEEKQHVLVTQFGIFPAALE